MLYESGIGSAEYCWKEGSVKKAECPIRSLVNARNLQLECERVRHEELLVPVLILGSDRMV